MPKLVVRYNRTSLGNLTSLNCKMGSLHRQNRLSKQTSAVFKMTLDELQASMGSGRPFGSMNMVLQPVVNELNAFDNKVPWLSARFRHHVQDEFLQTVWDKDPGLLNTQLSAEPMFDGGLFSQNSLDKPNLSLPQDDWSVHAVHNPTVPINDLLCSQRAKAALTASC